MEKLKFIRNENINKIFEVFNNLNKENYHSINRDDISTPMECVKQMVDYIPEEFWNRKNIKILDPCSGNGNFGAYIQTKTNIENIFFNDINFLRIQNSIKLLKPKHWNNEDFFNLTGKFDSKYDLIIGNPPYSGGGNKNKSISNKFIIESINRLNNNGYLCFITPNNWMSYNNNNETLKKLLSEGSFLIIDNDVKKFFKNVGSSFTVLLWQKGVFNNKTKIINNYLKKDIQENIVINKNIPFIPLYIYHKIF